MLRPQHDIRLAQKCFNSYDTVLMHPIYFIFLSSLCFSSLWFVVSFFFGNEILNYSACTDSSKILAEPYSLFLFTTTTLKGLSIAKVVISVLTVFPRPERGTQAFLEICLGILQMPPHTYFILSACNLVCSSKNTSNGHIQSKAIFTVRDAE